MEMESRARWTVSPERQRPAFVEPRKVPVLYYLSRKRQLEHPHFIEVPLSSQEGLFLKDVINRLNAVRGKGMATMYSWSCKRSYKNGFVWHDLSADDLVIPANGGEYVLKGSELLDQCPSDRSNSSDGRVKQQNELTKLPKRIDASPASPREEEESPVPCRSNSSDNISSESGAQRPPSSGSPCSPGPSEYRVFKPVVTVDAATQTEDGVTRRTRQVQENFDNGFSLRHELIQCSARRSMDGHANDKQLMPPSPLPLNLPLNHGKSGSLESLIRAENNDRINSFRLLEEDEIVVPTCPKLRPANVLMQLITCGSISSKDHGSFGLVPAYKPRFLNMKFPSPMISRTMMMGEPDYLSDNLRLIALRLEDKEYFSGSIIETKKRREVAGERLPTLKRSSSYNADRKCKSVDIRTYDEEIVDISHSRCLPRAAKLTSILQPKNETLRSPLSDCPRRSSVGTDYDHSSREGSKRFTNAAVQGSSMRTYSFKKEKEKLVKIEERLSSGARVIIQSRVPRGESDESSDGQ